MGNKTKIWFGEDAELRDALLQKLEENGVLWRGGKRPTKFTPRGCAWFLIWNKELLYGITRNGFAENVADELMPDEYLSLGTSSNTYFCEEEFLSMLS
jgi:hypothetical protein